jgi:hypothetical protein
VPLTTEDVCCDVGKVIDVGVKMGGVMADGAITTKSERIESYVSQKRMLSLYSLDI